MKIAAVAALGVAVSGCATIVKGTSQVVSVSTPPATGANCVLTNPEGSWTITTPAQVKVSKSKEDLVAKCTMPGYQDATQRIASSFQSWTAGNVLIGGVIGIGVDAASGAMNEYPTTITIPMSPVGASAPPVAPAPSSATATPPPPAAAKPNS